MSRGLLLPKTFVTHTFLRRWLKELSMDETAMDSPGLLRYTICGSYLALTYILWYPLLL